MFNLKKSRNMFYDKNTQKVNMVKRLLLALVGILFFTFVIFSYLDYKFEITRFAKLGTDVIQPTALDIPGGILGIVCCVIDFVKEVKKIKESKK